MTREEAITFIKEIKGFYGNKNKEGLDFEFVALEKEEIEALDMAIEALNREQKKYEAICNELLELKSDLNLPIEVAMAYEHSISVVRKYAKMGGTK